MSATAASILIYHAGRDISAVMSRPPHGTPALCRPAPSAPAKVRSGCQPVPGASDLGGDEPPASGRTVPVPAIEHRRYNRRSVSIRGRRRHYHRRWIIVEQARERDSDADVPSRRAGAGAAIARAVIRKNPMMIFLFMFCSFRAAAVRKKLPFRPGRATADPSSFVLRHHTAERS